MRIIRQRQRLRGDGDRSALEFVSLREVNDDYTPRDNEEFVAPLQGGTETEDAAVAPAETPPTDTDTDTDTL